MIYLAQLAEQVASWQDPIRLICLETMLSAMRSRKATCSFLEKKTVPSSILKA